MSTYKVRHKKTGNIVKVDDRNKKVCDKYGYHHVPKLGTETAGISMGVSFDEDGNIIRGDD